MHNFRKRNLSLAPFSILRSESLSLSHSLFIYQVQDLHIIKQYKLSCLINLSSDVVPHWSLIFIPLNATRIHEPKWMRIRIHITESINPINYQSIYPGLRRSPTSSSSSSWAAPSWPHTSRPWRSVASGSVVYLVMDPAVESYRGIGSRVGIRMGLTWCGFALIDTDPDQVIKIIKLISNHLLKAKKKYQFWT